MNISKLIATAIVAAGAFTLAACGGGANVGAPAPVVPTTVTAAPSPAATASATVTPAASPSPAAVAVTPATPAAGSTSGATPGPAATSGANARTPASCVAGSTPAPIATGSSLGMGSFYGAWGAPVGSSASAPTNGSVRDMAMVTIGGSAVRIRLVNPDTANPLVVCAAYIGLQQTNPGPALVPGSSRQITFNGAPGITLPPNTPYAYSDPVTFAVKAQQIVAVSLYLSSTTAATAATATWNSSYATASGAGDETRDETGAGFTTDLAGAAFDATFGTGQQEDLQQGVDYALSGIDVLTPDANGSVVMLGSSTFQGYESEQDEYDHVVDLLGTRITNEIPAGMRKGLVNEGLGGDSLFVALANRFQRDVLSQTGVTGLFLYDINDLDTQNTGQTAATVEANYKLAASMAHAHGIRVFCSTWAPESVSDTSEITTMARSQVNAFILNSGTCDATVDWATTLAEPGVLLSYNPAYFSDSIHANAAGHAAISAAVPLTQFFEAGGYP